MVALQSTYNIDANKNSTAAVHFDDDREDSAVCVLSLASFSEAIFMHFKDQLLRR